MKKTLFVFGCLTMFLIGCSPKTTEGNVEPVETAKIIPNEVQPGKTLFEANCQKCHKLKVIDNYSVEAWSKILPVMAKKAHLDEEQTLTINNYIQWELVN